MPAFIKKSIVVLAGAAFFLSGALIVSAASGPANFDPNSANVDSAAKLGLNCGITLDLPAVGEVGSGSIKDCIPVAVYYVIYKPASWLLIGAVYVFDTTIALSIDKSFVNQTFVDSTWKIIRDFSNMLFIFILLYAGIMTMFGAIDWKRTVIRVVIVALLINFSLFFTKVVIDAGNVLAVGVYSAMGTPKAAGDQHLTNSTVGERNIATAIAGSFQPQVFLKAAGKVDPMDAIVIFVIAAIVSVVAAWVFFKAALLFIGRLIAFWFLMIVSPFAFISTAFPGGKGNKFGSWLDTLLGQAFVAPLFLFLIYLIMQVVGMSGGILQSFTGGASGSLTGFVFQTLIAPIIVAILIIIALSRALKLAEDMAGDFGKLGAKIGGTVMGVAGGAALGATAVAGRTTIGRAAQRLEESGKLKQWATSDSRVARFAGRNLIGVNDRVRQGTFDVRGVGAVQKAAGAAGVASIGKPWAGAKGGFEGEQKRQAEKDEKFAKRLEMTADEKKAIENKYDVAAKEKEVGQHTEKAKELDGRVKEAKDKLAEAEKAGIEADIAVARAIVEKAEADLVAANELKKEKDATLAAAKASAKDEIDKENARRAGKFADHVEGRNVIASMGTYSRKQAQQTADKIRKGETKDEKAQKEWEKRMKKMMEEMTKEAEKPAEGGEKKSESPAH